MLALLAACRRSRPAAHASQHYLHAPTMYEIDKVRGAARTARATSRALTRLCTRR